MTKVKTFNIPLVAVSDLEYTPTIAPSIDENKPNTTNSNIIQNNDTNMYKNITNTNESTDKAFQILKDRLDNGLITLDEFNKKCASINKTRN